MLWRHMLGGYPAKRIASAKGQAITYQSTLTKCKKLDALRILFLCFFWCALFGFFNSRIKEWWHSLCRMPCPKRRHGCFCFFLQSCRALWWPEGKRNELGRRTRRGIINPLCGDIELGKINNRRSKLGWIVVDTDTENCKKCAGDGRMVAIASVACPILSSFVSFFCCDCRLFCRSFLFIFKPLGFFSRMSLRCCRCYFFPIVLSHHTTGSIVVAIGANLCALN